MVVYSSHRLATDEGGIERVSGFRKTLAMLDRALNLSHVDLVCRDDYAEIFASPTIVGFENEAPNVE